MNNLEQIAEAIEKEIEALRKTIEERYQLIEEQASVEFPMYWYKNETGILERKKHNLEESLMWLTSDIYLGNEEEQAKRKQEAPKEEAAAKCKRKNPNEEVSEQKKKKDLKVTEAEDYELELDTFCGTEYYDLNGEQVKEIIEGIQRGEKYFDILILEGAETTVIPFDTRCHTFRIYNEKDQAIVFGNKKQVEFNF